MTVTRKHFQMGNTIVPRSSFRLFKFVAGLLFVSVILTQELSTTWLLFGM